jgi:hypothetical protein
MREKKRSGTGMEPNINWLELITLKLESSFMSRYVVLNDF